MLGLGMTRKAIGDELGISQKTVEFHISGTDNPKSLTASLGLGSHELVRFAIEHGMVKPGEKTMNPRTQPNGNGQSAPAAHKLKSTGDLAQALLDAASAAAAGSADVLQVNALCQCTSSLIELAKLQIQANEKLGGQTKVPWLLSD
jgi:hypothetical protein